jgi:predicted amidophosphoribosyltransferase
MIHAYKFGDRPRMADLFSKMLLEMFLVFGEDVNTVVPVPTTMMPSEEEVSTQTTSY